MSPNPDDIPTVECGHGYLVQPNTGCPTGPGCNEPTRICPQHDRQLIDEPGGPTQPTISGRTYCSACQRDLNAALDATEDVALLRCMKCDSSPIVAGTGHCRSCIGPVAAVPDSARKALRRQARQNLTDLSVEAGLPD